MRYKASALVQGLVRCHDCGRLSRLDAQLPHCPVCGSRLHERMPQSLQRCLAFLLSSYALYLPANIFSDSGPLLNKISIVDINGIKGA